MGSIRVSESQTEIDSVPPEIRQLVGDIILNFALLQSQLSELFAAVCQAKQSYFTYLGHNVDISTMTTAIIRLLSSYEKPEGDFSSLIRCLKKCKELSEERNKMAHSSLIFDPQAKLLMRSEIRGGSESGRVGQILRGEHFQSILSSLKKQMWTIRMFMIENHRYSRKQ